MHRLGYRVWAAGLRIEGLRIFWIILGYMVLCLGCRVYGLKCWVKGQGSRVWSIGL